MQTRRIGRKPLLCIQPSLTRRSTERRTGVVIEISHPTILPFACNLSKENYTQARRRTLKSATLPLSLFPVENTSFYKRATFVTHLPVGRLYSPAHFWLAPESENQWQVGFTKFATRMLGDLVDHQWEIQPGQPVQPGQILGSIEGFKAISDLYCAGSGTFLEGNPQLRDHIELLTEKPYDTGWLYRFEGTPDPKCMPLDSYRSLLDATIDRILEKQQG